MLENILVVYLVFVNIAAFGMYGIDKQKAIRKQWRIPEAQLLAVAATCFENVNVTVTPAVSSAPATLRHTKILT